VVASARREFVNTNVVCGDYFASAILSAFIHSPPNISTAYVFSWAPTPSSAGLCHTRYQRVVTRHLILTCSSCVLPMSARAVSSHTPSCCASVPDTSRAGFPFRLHRQEERRLCNPPHGSSASLRHSIIERTSATQMYRNSSSHFQTYRATSCICTTRHQ